MCQSISASKARFLFHYLINQNLMPHLEGSSKDSTLENDVHGVNGDCKTVHDLVRKAIVAPTGKAGGTSIGI